MKTNKYISIILSIVLITSNIPVFAQNRTLESIFNKYSYVRDDMRQYMTNNAGPKGVGQTFTIDDVIDPRFLDDFDSKLAKMNEGIDNLIQVLRDTDKSVLGDFVLGESRLGSSLESILKQVSDLQGAYKECVPNLKSTYGVYLEKMDKYLGEPARRAAAGETVDLTGDVMDRITRRYLNETKQPMIGKVYNLDTRLGSETLSKMEEIITQAIKKGKYVNYAELEELANLFKTDLTMNWQMKITEMRNGGKQMFESLKTLSSMFPRRSIFAYTMRSFTPQQQAKINLLLEAGSEAPNYRQLAKGMNQFAGKFAKYAQRRGLFKTFKLTRELKGLSKEARIARVTDLTKPNAGERRFVRDIIAEMGTPIVEKTTQVARKAGSRILIGIGAVILIMTVTDVKAENNFQEGSYMDIDFSGGNEIGNVVSAIENDEYVSPEALAQFFMDERSEEYVEKNNAYYALMLVTAAGLAQMEIDQEKLLNILQEPEFNEEESSGGNSMQGLDRYMHNPNSQRSSSRK